MPVYPCYVDTHVATQVLVRALAFMIAAPGIHVTIFAFTIVLDVILNFIDHDPTPDWIVSYLLFVLLGHKDRTATQNGNLMGRGD